MSDLSEIVEMWYKDGSVEFFNMDSPDEEWIATDQPQEVKQ